MDREASKAQTLINSTNKTVPEQVQKTQEILCEQKDTFVSDMLTAGLLLVLWRDVSKTTPGGVYRQNLSSCEDIDKVFLELSDKLEATLGGGLNVLQAAMYDLGTGSPPFVPAQTVLKQHVSVKQTSTTECAQEVDVHQTAHVPPSMEVEQSASVSQESTSEHGTSQQASAGDASGEQTVGVNQQVVEDEQAHTSQSVDVDQSRGVHSTQAITVTQARQDHDQESVVKACMSEPYASMEGGRVFQQEEVQQEQQQHAGFSEGSDASTHTRSAEGDLSGFETEDNATHGENGVLHYASHCAPGSLEILYAGDPHMLALLQGNPHNAPVNVVNPHMQQEEEQQEEQQQEGQPQEGGSQQVKNRCQIKRRTRLPPQKVVPSEALPNVSSSDASAQTSGIPVDLANIVGNCAICLYPICDASYVMPCQHIVHLKCLEDLRASRHKNQCPICREACGRPSKLVASTQLDNLLQAIVQLQHGAASDVAEGEGEVQSDEMEGEVEALVEFLKEQDAELQDAEQWAAEQLAAEQRAVGDEDEGSNEAAQNEDEGEEEEEENATMDEGEEEGEEDAQIHRSRLIPRPRHIIHSDEENESDSAVGSGSSSPLPFSSGGHQSYSSDDAIMSGGQERVRCNFPGCDNGWDDTRECAMCGHPHHHFCANKPQWEEATVTPGGTRSKCAYCSGVVSRPLPAKRTPTPTKPSGKACKSCGNIPHTNELWYFSKCADCLEKGESGLPSSSSTPSQQQPQQQMSQQQAPHQAPQRAQQRAPQQAPQQVLQQTQQEVPQPVQHDEQHASQYEYAAGEIIMGPFDSTMPQYCQWCGVWMTQGTEIAKYMLPPPVDDEGWAHHGCHTTKDHHSPPSLGTPTKPSQSSQPSPAPASSWPSPASAQPAAESSPSQPHTSLRLGKKCRLCNKVPHDNQLHNPHARGLCNDCLEAREAALRKSEEEIAKFKAAQEAKAREQREQHEQQLQADFSKNDDIFAAVDWDALMANPKPPLRDNTGDG